MSQTSIAHKLLVAAGIILIATGLGLGVWAVTQLVAAPDPAVLTIAGAAANGAASAARPAADADSTPAAVETASQAEPTATSVPAVAVQLEPGVAAGLRTALADLAVDGARIVTPTAGLPTLIRLGTAPVTGTLVYTETFAAATRFDTVDTAIRWGDLRANWAGRVMTYTTIAVLSDTLPALTQVLGPPGPAVAGVATVDELVERAWQDRTTAAILPFEQLVPRLAVLAIDGQNPLENVNHFDPSRYPLVTATYAQVDATDPANQALAARVLAALPAGNRDPSKLTVIAMTGVTAMTRQTAEQMERLGSAWPTEEVGPELASADITHISNEVPFVPGCMVNTNPENFNFCSKPEYMATLEASGADIIGLTGNHQNDFGPRTPRFRWTSTRRRGFPSTAAAATRRLPSRPWS